MVTRKRGESWEVSEEFWRRVEPLMPVRERSSDRTYVRKAGVEGCGCVRGPVEGRACRVRPDGGYRLAMAEH